MDKDEYKGNLGLVIFGIFIGIAIGYAWGWNTRNDDYQKAIGSSGQYCEDKIWENLN